MVNTVPHIRLDEDGRPWVDDNNIKVIEVVLDHLGYGWNAETIQENHPIFLWPKCMPRWLGITTAKSSWTEKLSGRISAFAPCVPPANHRRSSNGWLPIDNPPWKREVRPDATRGRQNQKEAFLPGHY